MQRGRPPPSHRQSQQIKERKVAQFKRWNQYQRALKSAGNNEEQRSSPNATVTSGSTSSADAADATSSRPFKRKKSPKRSAADVARHKYERDNAEHIAAQEAEEAAKRERQQDKEMKQRERRENVAIYKKRTKRGQPMLGHQVDVLLAKLQKQYKS